MTGHSRHTANASQSYTFAIRTGLLTIKNCKRVWLSQRTTDRKDAAKMKDNLTEKINNETLTKVTVARLPKKAII